MAQLRIEAFDPVPDDATLAINLIAVGVYIASSAAASALSPLPFIVHVSDVHIRYVFGVVLLLVFLFGIGMILTGWLVSDDTPRYAAFGRAMMRAGQVVLVFAIAFREAATTQTNTSTTNK